MVDAAPNEEEKRAEIPQPGIDANSRPKRLLEWYVRRASDPTRAELFLRWEGGEQHLALDPQSAYDLSDRLLVLTADLINRKNPAEADPSPP